MQLPMNKILSRAGSASCAIVFILAGCSGVENSLQHLKSFEREMALPNVSLEGSPNQTVLGPIDPHQKTARTRVGRNVIIAAFRTSGCGRPAPDFEKMMRDQVGRGLSVPDGITLYDAGVGSYTSTRCGPDSKVRAIGARAHRKGTYVLDFFQGKATRTLTVR